MYIVFICNSLRSFIVGQPIKTTYSGYSEIDRFSIESSPPVHIPRLGLVQNPTLLFIYLDQVQYRIQPSCSYTQIRSSIESNHKCVFDLLVIQQIIVRLCSRMKINMFSKIGVLNTVYMFIVLFKITIRTVVFNLYSFKGSTVPLQSNMKNQYI